MFLVTGGAGFIGSNLVAALSARGEEVVVCDRLGSDDRWRNLATSLLDDIIAPERLADFLGRHGRDVHAILHMGAISATTETDVDLIVDSNIRLTRDLWDWCAHHGTRLVYASSAATYGDGSAGFHDDDAPEHLEKLRPLNAYGWSKHVVDRRIAQVTRTGRSAPPQWVGLKFFNVYGPNEYHKGSMQSVVAKAYPVAARGDVVTLFRSHHPDYADGGQLRDFVYVKDCVRVIEWLLDHREVSGLFNVGTGTARSFADLVHALFAALDLEPKIAFVDMPEQIRDKYQYFTQAEMGKLRAAGYHEPMMSLEEGVRDYVQRHLASVDPYAGSATYRAGASAARVQRRAG